MRAHQPDIQQMTDMLREQLPTLKSRHRVETIGLFGSYVRGENRPDSDLDVLVTFEEPPGLIDFLRLENYLSDVLAVQVDLVMKSALKPRIRKRILAEVVTV